MLPGPIPSYIGREPGGNPVQVHLIQRQSPSFPQLAELLVKALAHPPSDPFQILDLPDEIAVVTGGLPPGVGFEDWIRETTSGAQTPQGPSASQAPSIPQDPSPPTGSSAPSAAEESYTQFFQLPQDPPTNQSSVASSSGTQPGNPDTTPEPSDYSEFFQVPVPGKPGGPDSATPREPDPLPPPPAQPVSIPEPSNPVRFEAPPPPPPTQAGPPPSIPTQLAVPAPPPNPTPPPSGRTPAAQPPAGQPDPDSITAEFRRPMPPPNKPSGRGRNWTPSQRGAKPQMLAMGEYLSRLDSAASPSAPGTPRPPAPPAAPSWASHGGGQRVGGPSAPTVVTRAPTPHGEGAAPMRRFRTRDLVIFGAVLSVVIIAAITTVVIVILSTD